MPKIAVLQMTSGIDPAANAASIASAVHDAKAGGAEMLFAPEMSGLLDRDRKRAAASILPESESPVLTEVRQAAATAEIMVALGSLAVAREDGRWANRSFVIDGTGEVIARYDKIHMFDVDVTATETFRESAGYRPGDRAVVVDTPFGKIGLSICYDVRFAHLYRRLAKAGAEILLVPAAFSPVTGEAHWEPLLRARAIENGCFVLAAAQTGDHPITKGKPRVTHGHSMVIGPWGNVMVDAGTETGIVYADIDLGEVARARGRVPSLTHDRPFEGP